MCYQNNTLSSSNGSKAKNKLRKRDFIFYWPKYTQIADPVLRNTNMYDI